jgi:tetratricopeptide (TPR) repeat protein
MFCDRIFRFPALALAVLWSVVPSSVEAAQDQLDAWSVDHFQHALEAQKSRKFDRALQEYQLVITRNPKFAEAYLNLGIVFQLQSKYPESIRALQAALKVKPALSAAEVLLGIGQYMVQDFASAHHTLENALTQNPRERQAGVYLALTLIAEDRPEAAARQLQQTARYYQDDIEISYYRGVAYTEGVKKSAQVLLTAGRESALYYWAMAISADQKSDTGSALVDCLNALAIDPNIPQLYSFLGSLFEKAGYSDLARDAESRLRGSPPAEDPSAPERKQDYVDLWMKLGPVHPDPTLPHVADTYIDKLVQKEIAADQTGTLQGAVASYEQSDFQSAEARLTSEKNEAARPWVFAYLLARCELEAREVEAAEQVLETSLSAQLSLPSVALLKLQIQSELALRSFDAVISKQPDSNAGRLLQAKSLAAANNPDKAIEEYQEVLRLQPGLPEIHLAIAQLEADRLHWPEVIEEIHKELAVGPQNSLAFALLAHAYAETDQGKEAIPLLTKVLTQYPDDADALADLGKSYAQTGNRAKAIGAYEKALAADQSRYRIHYRLFQLYQSSGQTDLAQQHLALFQAQDAERRAKATVIR